MMNKLKLRIANLMPRWLVYCCGIRLIVHATCGKYGDQVVPKLTAVEALKRWEEEGK